MYKYTLSILCAVVLLSCSKDNPIDKNFEQTLSSASILKMDGQSYHTCPEEKMPSGKLGHWCRPGGRNCVNTDRHCRDIDINGNNNKTFSDILSSGLDNIEEYELFWSCAYDAAFVREHYDMFIDLHTNFDGIHPDEQIEALGQ